MCQELQVAVSLFGAFNKKKRGFRVSGVQGFGVLVWVWVFGV